MTATRPIKHEDSKAVAEASVDPVIGGLGADVVVRVADVPGEKCALERCRDEEAGAGAEAEGPLLVVEEATHEIPREGCGQTRHERPEGTRADGEPHY